jgi:hypothetical protein
MAKRRAVIPTTPTSKSKEGLDRPHADVTSVPGRRSGRPRKFSRPAMAVTLTLPEEVIAILEAIDPDIGRAIVRLMEPLVAQQRRLAAPFAIVGDRSALIVLSASRTLEEHTGLQLVRLPDGRALVSFPANTTVADVEVRLRDALAELALSPDETTIFEGLASVLKDVRLGRDTTCEARRIVLLRQPSHNGGNGHQDFLAG